MSSCRFSLLWLVEVLQEVLRLYLMYFKMIECRVLTPKSLIPNFYVNSSLQYAFSQLA